jgi:hypothetical protein
MHRYIEGLMGMTNFSAGALVNVSFGKIKVGAVQVESSLPIA